MEPGSGHQDGPEHGQWFRSRTSWAWIGFIAVAGFFLLTEHRAHGLGALPFLLLLACPLMRLFHLHGHGSHGAGGSHSGQHQDPAQRGRK